MKISKGIYDKKNGYSVKIISIQKKSRKNYAVMQFTNNPNYGKSHFAMEGKSLSSFLKGYKKRR